MKYLQFYRDGQLKGDLLPVRGTVLFVSDNLPSLPVAVRKKSSQVKMRYTPYQQDAKIMLYDNTVTHITHQHSGLHNLTVQQPLS